MDQQNTANQTKWLYLFIGLAVVLNFSGLFITIMGPDGNLYATIAKTMVLRNNYADLYAWGNDWLDKPHFPFWVTALFFKCFGFTTWAYKLPGILFVMMGSIYTYRFAKALYNKQIALWAVLILLTSQHILLSNNDVRAEPYLTGLIVAAVYHFYKAYTRPAFTQLLLGCLFTACAVMTKGMFALITIGGAIVGHLLITRQWKQLFHWRWLLAIVLVLLFIMPEIWCLYRQFDLQPEKIVFGRTGVSGIKFFFWDSQFGRFFNTGPIKGHGDPSFFIHTTLWAFLPWSLLLFAAIFQFVKKGVKNVQAQEWYCLCGSMITFLLFSASKFQLPHYIVIVFPFFAIITAQYLSGLTSAKSINAVRVTQGIVIVLMLITIGLLQYFYRPETFGWLPGIIILALLIALVFVPTRISADVQQIILRTLLAAFIVNVYLNLCFYPSLLHYQSGSEAAMWINKNNPEKLPVFIDDGMFHDDAIFYLNAPLTELKPDEKVVVTRPSLLYANTGVINDYKAHGWNFKVIKTFKRYPVTRLKPTFLNQTTRNQEISETQVVLLTPPITAR